MEGIANSRSLEEREKLKLHVKQDKLKDLFAA
jgi:hypothetical protein